ncbi:MAG: outer membrane lipoprotein-sorting protein [Elusimicrobiota bacterium]
MKRIALFLSLILLSAPGYCAGPKENPDIKQIVKKIDNLYRSKSNISRIEMSIVTPHWQRTLSMDAWGRGTTHTFIRILSPQKEKGVATLRIGNEMWNYLPNAGKVIKIPPSMMMSSWMGSDFTNDDLVKESSLVDDYNYKLAAPDGAKAGLIYIEFIPKEDKPIVWGRILLAVREKDYIPVSEEYFDEKGKLMRVLNFSAVKKFGKRDLPSVMEMIPQNKAGHKTVITYLKADFDVQVKDDVFTLRNLQSKE